MQDLHTPLRTLYYELITEENLSCFENGAVPDDQPMPYVVIVDIRASEASNKTGFGNTVQVALDIVTGYLKNNATGSKEADTIAGVILSKMNSKIKVPIFSGLQIVNTKILQDQKLNSKTETHNIYRRIIRYQHLIMEV